MTFGMIYWLAPRLFQAPLHSKSLATLHFWIATIGIVLYVIAMWAAGITQGLMWRAFDDTGRLQYPDFLQTVTKLMPMYYVRALGGTLYIVGFGLCIYNVFMTWRARPATYEEPTFSAPPLDRTPEATGVKLHRRWEGLPRLFTILVVLAVVAASLFEIIPTIVVGTNEPRIASVKPYTPLELYGRDIYLREGCYNCHSQMIRPFVDEVVRFGEYSKPGEFVYDHPFQWGSRRIGPDLAREGGRRHRRLARPPHAQPALDLAGLDHADLPGPVLRPHPVERGPGPRRGDADPRRPLQRRRGQGRQEPRLPAGPAGRRADRHRGRPRRPRGQGDRRADRVPAAPRHRHQGQGPGRRRRARARPAEKQP